MVSCLAYRGRSAAELPALTDRDLMRRPAGTPTTPLMFPARAGRYSGWSSPGDGRRRDRFTRQSRPAESNRRTAAASICPAKATSTLGPPGSRWNWGSGRRAPFEPGLVFSANPL